MQRQNLPATPAVQFTCSSGESQAMRLDGLQRTERLTAQRNRHQGINRMDELAQPRRAAPSLRRANRTTALRSLRRQAENRVGKHDVALHVDFSDRGQQFVEDAPLGSVSGARVTYPLAASKGSSKLGASPSTTTRA